MTTVEKTAKKMPLAMRGHIAARNYLVRNGFRIMEDGYSCGQGGSISLPWTGRTACASWR